MHELSCHSLWCWCCPGTVVRGSRVGLVVLNGAIVKFFTSCLVKRDHSVVKMKVFEIFIPCLHGLGMENKCKTNKQKPPPSPQPKSCLVYVRGWRLAGAWEEVALPLRPLSTHSGVHFLLLHIPDH